MKTIEGVPLYTRAHYARVLTPQLPARAFEPAVSRLLLIPMWVALIVVATLAIAMGAPWFALPALSLVIGVSFAGLTFIAHEAMHGGIVRGKRRQHLVGLIGFLPFMLSPRLWVAWHNRAHHAHTNLDDDPDAYPSLERYQQDRGTRFAVDAFSLGGGRWRGGLSLILGFTVQSSNLLLGAHQRGILSRRQHRLAIAETAGAVLVWATVAVLIGFVPFLFAFVLPVLIANVMVMSFILTNHSLSPRIAVNDPLVSGLTVTTSRWYEKLTLGFGYHVEHHLFPAMSSRHAPHVRALAKKHWPERYKSMSLHDALQALHHTGRVYKDATTLLDPRSGREFPTLLPGVLAATRG